MEFHQTCSNISLGASLKADYILGDLDLFSKSQEDKYVIFSLKLIYLLSIWLDCHQTCTDISLRQYLELIMFWSLDPISKLKIQLVF